MNSPADVGQAVPDCISVTAPALDPCWHKLFEQMREGFMICELKRNEEGAAEDFILLQVNPAWSREFSRRHVGSDLPIIGQTASVILGGLESYWLDKFQQVIDAQQAIYFSAYSGSFARWYQVNAYPCDGEKFAAVFLDVTGKRVLEQELQKTRQRQLRASRLNAMTALAATLAHELNQPLGAASNFIGAAKLSIAPMVADYPEVLDLLNAAERGILHSSDIIRKMREFAVQGTIEFEEVALKHAIELAAAEAVAAGECPDLIIQIDVQERAEQVLGSAVQLHQVFANIIRNAYTAMEGKDLRQIVVNAERIGDRIKVSFSDFGKGIATIHIDRIFDAFEEGSGRGLGLGLAICRTIVEAHGGSISASPLPNGTTINVFLRASMGESSSSKRKHEALGEKPGH